MTAPTLTEFLLARIAEDEADYREALGDEEHQDWAVNRSGDYNDGYIVTQALRMLAECEAKRRIVERAASLAAWDEMGSSTRDDGEAILRALAQPYADHPDFREEWHGETTREG